MIKRYRNTDYYVDDCGNVYSSKTNKLLRLQSNGHYLKVTLTIKGKQVQKLVHRLVAELFIPNPKSLPEVNHKNGIKEDNHASNLEWVTPSENQQHSVRIGLRKFGTDLWNGKFNKTQVEDIIQKRKDGVSCRKLGKEYGCDPTTISTIARGLRYKNYFNPPQHALRLCRINKEITV